MYTIDILYIWQHNPMIYDRGAFQIIVNGKSSNMAIRLGGVSFKRLKYFVEGITYTIKEGIKKMFFFGYLS